MPSPDRADIIQRQLATIYNHHGESCELLQAGQSVGSGVTVLPMLETDSEETGTGYANAGEFIHVGFTARFRRHELADKGLVLVVGMTLIPTTSFAGHDAFEITSEPMPHGRKADQLTVQITEVPIP